MRKNREDEVWPRGFAHACEEEMLNVVRKRFGGEKEFIACKLRTNSACEDEYMLVRKKQCLEILNPGCGTCLYDEMSSSLGYWTMTLDIINSSFCQVYQQGGGLTCSSKLFCNSIIWIR